MVEEKVALYVEVKGKDDVRMRQQFAEMRPGELWRSRERERTHAEDEPTPPRRGRSVGTLQDAARPQTGHEREVRARVRAKRVDMIGGPSCDCEEQEKYLQLWTNELQKVAQEEERRLEARETRKMSEEDARSRSHQICEWWIGFA